MEYLSKETRVRLTYIFPKWTIYNLWDIPKAPNMPGIQHNVLYELNKAEERFGVLAGDTGQ